MVQMRATILGIVRPNPVLISPTVPGYIDALFAGIVLETMFLASALTTVVLLLGTAAVQAYAHK